MISKKFYYESKLLQLQIQKMLLVEGSNFDHNEEFLPIFQILKVV